MVSKMTAKTHGSAERYLFLAPVDLNDDVGDADSRWVDVHLRQGCTEPHLELRSVGSDDNMGDASNCRIGSAPRLPRSRATRCSRGRFARREYLIAGFLRP